jgi:hypothetical protein
MKIEALVLGFTKIGEEQQRLLLTSLKEIWQETNIYFLYYFLGQSSRLLQSTIAENAARFVIRQIITGRTMG